MARRSQGFHQLLSFGLIAPSRIGTDDGSDPGPRRFFQISLKAGRRRSRTGDRPNSANHFPNPGERSSQAQPRERATPSLGIDRFAHEIVPTEVEAE